MQPDQIALIEAAFREGYKEGYDRGQSVQVGYERGEGTPSQQWIRHVEDEAWIWSDAMQGTLSRDTRLGKI